MGGTNGTDEVVSIDEFSLWLPFDEDPDFEDFSRGSLSWFLLELALLVFLLYLLSFSLALPDEVDWDRMLLFDECPWLDDPLPVGVVGEEPVGSWVAVPLLGEGPLDDLLELPPDPPDFRSFVVDPLAAVVTEPPDVDRFDPDGKDATDTDGLVGNPPPVVEVVWELVVVIALSEADVDAVLWWLEGSDSDSFSGDEEGSLEPVSFVTGL